METEAPGGLVTCGRSHSGEIVEAGFELRVVRIENPCSLLLGSAAYCSGQDMALLSRPHVGFNVASQDHSKGSSGLSRAESILFFPQNLPTRYL